ncbi:hypothetical protein N7478_002090 [Penicillium angulare]|uniref:uncharacterized protein n=1 Tax=Penicillium angulare TaxID=116970 RepID=UPI00253FD163|nr:uncharacterized protein N7478_002090 [Penicillium angulare]KAJ5289060.1 hypothetical protein N7478_002090 [Penicillium angulare]
MAPEQPTMKVYQPYDIEEPDDDLDFTVRGLDLCLPDSFERWQRDFADHMDDSTSALSPVAKQVSSPRRGQKRKSSSVPAGSGHYSASPSSYRPNAGSSLADEALPVPGLNPKRRRRRSRLAADSAKVVPVVSLDDFRDPEMNEDSSSDVWSTDESADTMHDSSVTDDMDLD